MKIKKITTGFVVQTYDTEKKEFIEQEFLPLDYYGFEDEEGKLVDASLFPDDDIPYMPFDMVQPKNKLKMTFIE